MKKTKSKMKNIKKNPEGFFKSKPVTLAFGAVAVISGLFFIGQGSITGNAIVKSPVQNPSLLLSIIGLLLIACSIVLFAYSAKKK